MTRGRARIVADDCARTGEATTSDPPAAIPRRINSRRWSMVVSFPPIGLVSSLSATVAGDRPDRPAGDHHVVQIQVNILARHGGLAAVINVDPDLLDPERVHVAEADVGLLERRLAIDPAAEDAVGGAFSGVAAGCVEFAVFFDAI